MRKAVAAGMAPYGGWSTTASRLSLAVDPVIAAVVLAETGQEPVLVVDVVRAS